MNEKIFLGNSDRDSVVSNTLSPVILARFIRLYPVDYMTLFALRVEFLGSYEGNMITKIEKYWKFINKNPKIAYILLYNNVTSVCIFIGC